MPDHYSVIVYRRLCRVDATARAKGEWGPPRFDYLTGTEEDMREWGLDSLRRFEADHPDEDWGGLLGNEGGVNATPR
jgi:hypothetical protein